MTEVGAAQLASVVGIGTDLVRSAVPARPEAKTGVTAWQDCQTLEKKLSGVITKELKGTDKESVKAFLAEPKNRLRLAQWQLAHQENTGNASKLSATAGEPRTMNELISNAGFRAKELIKQVTNDPEWLEQLVYSGECKNPGRALAILAGLSEKHKGLDADRVVRDVATATAVEWALHGWDFKQALARGNFYIKNYKDKRFHKGFKSLPFWHYRVICGCKGDNANGSVASLEWALDNVHLPIDQYTGCCWQASYLDTNLFGDSVQGPHYYAPYNDVYGQNAVQRTLDVGGVCGSLSHYGAFAALGNGVPAMTAGEPEHCAYIVCVNGKWVPSYSLSWKRGLHWQVWSGIYKFASLHMATELNAPAQAANTALSNAYRTLAELYAAAGQKPKALVCYRSAVAAQPCNFIAWRSYAEFLKAQYPDNVAAWTALNKAVCVRLAPRYPEMAAELLRSHVYPGLKKAKATGPELMKCFTEFWAGVKGMGPDRWEIEQLCNVQKDSLKSDKVKDMDARLALYQMCLSQTASKAAYAPVILSWGNEGVDKMDVGTQKKFLSATLTALKKGGTGDMKEEDREKMLGQALLGTERMRDRTSFQAIGKLLPAKFRKPTLPEWESFPGQLVSRGGLLFISSTCQHDYPPEHWGVLEPTGGRFHTGGDKDAYGAVELPKMSYITGVVTIAPDGNLWRLTNMKVQYSETGKDDDWHDAGPMPNPTGQRVNRLDLQKSKPRARFIRILRPGGPELFHLNAIFVYGQPAS